MFQPIARVHVPAILLAIAIAVVGFWPTYFGLLAEGAPGLPLLIHLHAAAFVLWLLLFLAQAVLAASGHVALHIRLGPWAMAWAIVIVLMGVLVSSAGFGRRLAAGDIARAQQWLFGEVRDLACLVPFLVAGWRYRRRPEVHKRLMLVATTIMLLPAVTRMAFLGGPVPLWKFMLVWPLPVYLAMAHDAVKSKTVHPVYVVGVLTMLGMRLVLPLRDTGAWMDFAGWIAGFYGVHPS